MRPLLATALVLLLTGNALAVELRGWAEGSYFHPKNEYTFPYHGGTGHARYALEVYTEAEHEGFFIFVDSFNAFGHNRPQRKYTYRADPIAMDLKYGGGYRFGRYEIKITHHRNIDLGGGLKEPLYWNAVQFRVNF